MSEDTDLLRAMDTVRSRQGGPTHRIVARLRHTKNILTFELRDNVYHDFEERCEDALTRLEMYDEQSRRLTTFILSEVPGEPSSGEEDAVTIVIRLLRHYIAKDANGTVN